MEPIFLSNNQRTSAQGAGDTLPPNPTSQTFQFHLGNKLASTRVIGTGGMGTVLEVYHRELGVKRAVKLIDNQLLQQSEQVWLRFKQEALIASELSHPNIVKVYDLDRTPDGIPFILMEYLDGSDLESVIQERAPLPLEQVIRLLSGPADALDAVHRKGVVHRDLKPANLFLTQKGTVKVLDFGISQMAGKRDSKITQIGEVVGTPMYMSPEQLMGKEVDGRADVYALGIIAYELLVGKPIFDYENVNQIISAALSETPLPPTTVNPVLPFRYDAVFKKVFQKDAVHRYATALDFLRDLAGPSLVRVISSVIRNELVSAIDSSEFMLQSTISSRDIDKSVALSRGSGNIQCSEGRLDSEVSDSDASLLSGEKSKGMFRRWLYWGAFLIAGIITAAVWWMIAQPATTKVSVGVASVIVTNSRQEGPWEQEAISKLLNDYLTLEGRSYSIHPVASSGQISMKRGEVPFNVSFIMHYQGDWRGTMELARLDGEIVDTVSASGEGFETVIEDLTWHLNRFALEKGRFLHSPESADERDMAVGGGLKQISTMAVSAIIKQNLLPRVDRLRAQMPTSPDRIFLNSFYQYLLCISGEPASVCVARKPFPAYQETTNHVFNILWKHLALPLRSEPTPETCAIFDSTEPAVRDLFSILPSRNLCRFEEKPICQKMSSFWQRYTCALDSIGVDAMDTSLEYIYSGMEKDAGNGFYGTLDVMVTKGVNRRRGKEWVERLISRYGKEHLFLSGLLFAEEMAQRNTASALIWARRSSASQRKTALALMASGWLGEGIRKETEALLSLIEHSDNVTEKDVEKWVHASLYPIVVLKDASLAKMWKNQMTQTPTSSKVVKEALGVVEKLAGDDLSGLCKMTSTHFALEIDYICGRNHQICRNVPVTKDTLVSKGGAAYLVADAHYAMGEYREAESYFHEMEKNSFFRINFPVASILSLKRLGDVSHRLENTDKAKKYYQEFLSSWESLDVPIQDYLDATQYMTRH